jgi:hypothetical protein
MYIMSHCLKLLQTSLAVATGVLIMAGSGAAFAQRDCSKVSADMKAQCEARAKAEAKCDKLEVDARRFCMREELPRNCAKESNKASCEAEVAAHKVCRSDTKTYRACMESKRADFKKGQ